MDTTLDNMQTTAAPTVATSEACEGLSLAEFNKTVGAEQRRLERNREEHRRRQRTNKAFEYVSVFLVLSTAGAFALALVHSAFH